MARSVNLSFRVAQDLYHRLEALAKATDRTKSWLAQHALEEYLARQQWQTEAIEEGIAAANRGKTVPHEEVEAWLETWGQPDESDPPKCA